MSPDRAPIPLRQIKPGPVPEVVETLEAMLAAGGPALAARVTLLGDVPHARRLLDEYGALPNWPFKAGGQLSRCGSGLGPYAGCGATRGAGAA
jgi:hypothetical protein